MKLQSLEIQNFLGMGSARLDLDSRGLLLVTGLNHDSPTASSNGAGKSTIYEAIHWALWGKTKRGVSGDEVINRHTKEGCKVALQFAIGPEVYVVTRSRKDATHGTGLKLFQGEREITQGTVKDTQALLETVMGLSELTFSKVAYFGQGDLKPFASLSDSELKTVFEQALNLTELSTYQAAAKSERAARERELERLRGSIAEAERGKAHTEEKAELLQQSIVKMLLQAGEEAERIKNDIEREKQYQAQVCADIRDGQNALCVMETEIKAKKGKLSELQTLQKVLVEKKQAQLTEKGKIELFCSIKENELNRITQGITQAEAKTACAECGRPFSPQDKEAMKGLYLVKAQETRNEAADLAAKARANAEQLAKIGAIEAALNTQLSTMAQVIEAMKEAEARRATLAVWQKSLNESEQRAARLQMELERVHAQANTAAQEKELELLQAEARRLGIEAEALKTKTTAAESDVEAFQMLEEIYGNQGMKSYIFDSITPELNRLIAEHMAVLNPEVSVEVSTVKPLKGKKGEFREKFDIVVENLSGAASYSGNSDGEKQLVNLAIALAFNQLCRSMAKGSVNMLWMDEPLESLDDSSAEKAIELCNQFSGGVENLMIVSHNQAVKDLVANQLQVEKRGGLATIKA